LLFVIGFQKARQKKLSLIPSNRFASTQYGTVTGLCSGLAVGACGVALWMAVVCRATIAARASGLFFFFLFLFFSLPHRGDRQ